MWIVCAGSPVCKYGPNGCPFPLVRSAFSRTMGRVDSYTLELHRHGLESVEREVRWLNELIASERQAEGHDNISEKESS